MALTVKVGGLAYRPEIKRMGISIAPITDFNELTLHYVQCIQSSMWHCMWYFTASFANTVHMPSLLCFETLFIYYHCLISTIVYMQILLVRSIVYMLSLVKMWVTGFKFIHDQHCECLTVSGTGFGCFKTFIFIIWHRTLILFLLLFSLHHLWQAHNTPVCLFPLRMGFDPFGMHGNLVWSSMMPDFTVLKPLNDAVKEALIMWGQQRVLSHWMQWP